MFPVNWHLENACATLGGCSFFVPAYDNPDSKRYEKQIEKAHEELEKDPSQRSRPEIVVRAGSQNRPKTSNSRRIISLQPSGEALDCGILLI